MNKESNRSVAIVTGGTSGIGRAVAIELARRGHAVAVLDHARLSPIGEPQTTEAIMAHGGKSCFHECDVSDVRRVESAVQDVAAQWGKIGIVFNCAGVGQRFALVDGDVDQIRRIVEVNLMGTIWTCRAAIPHLEHDRGVIVNVASGQAVLGLGYNTIYAATKSAILRFSESLGRELRPHGIAVSVLIPDATRTPFAVLTGTRGGGGTCGASSRRRSECRGRIASRASIPSFGTRCDVWTVRDRSSIARDGYGGRLGYRQSHHGSLIGAPRRYRIGSQNDPKRFASPPMMPADSESRCFALSSCS